MKWERINSKKDLEITQRLKVYGGWLVLTSIKMSDVVTSISNYSTYCKSDLYTVTQTFVPDPNHEWEI